MQNSRYLQHCIWCILCHLGPFLLAWSQILHIANCSRWKSFGSSQIDWYIASCEIFPVKYIAIMHLYNKLWPHKTSMQLWMFSSKLQFISTPQKFSTLNDLQYTLCISVTINYWPCSYLYAYMIVVNYVKGQT